MCFCKCPYLKEIPSPFEDAGILFSYYTTSYTTTCDTFRDRFATGKKLMFCLDKISFLFFLQTVVQPLFTQQMNSPHAGKKNLLQHVSARFKSIHNKLLEHNSNFGVIRHYALILYFYFIIHHHHLHLPHHQKGMYKGESVDNGQATSLPFA